MGGVAEDPVGQVAADPGEQQAERDGPDRVGDPACEPQHHADRGDRDQAEDDGELGAGAERGARVAHQVQHEPVAEHLDVTLRQPLDGPGLGRDVDDVRRQRDQDEDGAGGAAGRSLWAGGPCVAGGQRRSSRCLHVMHSVARGKAMALILPMGFPQDSHMP